MTKRRYTQEDIDVIVAGFHDMTLPKAQWNHHAHVINAFWYHYHYDFEEALAQMRSKIRRYNEAVGIRNTAMSGYHETLTVFWMRLTKNFATMHADHALVDVINQFIKRYPDQELPLKYYEKELLFSSEARSRWINGNLRQIKLKDR
jgi:hypothetical protein